MWPSVREIVLSVQVTQGSWILATELVAIWVLKNLVLEKALKNYVRHIKNYFQHDSYSETHQKDYFWVILFTSCYCFQRTRPRPVTSSFTQRTHEKHQDLKDEKNSGFSEMLRNKGNWLIRQDTERMIEFNKRGDLENYLHSALKLLASNKQQHCKTRNNTGNVKDSIRVMNYLSYHWKSLLLTWNRKWYSIRGFPVSNKKERGV